LFIDWPLLFFFFFFVQRYTLPDGSVLKLQTEHVRCAEALFHPQLAGCRGAGLADMIYDIVETCMADRDGGPMRLLPQVKKI
jgi:hypothetical protein